MARSLWLALALTFLVPCAALAQAPVHHAAQAHDDELTLTLDASTADDLASIDAESHAATGLYIAAVALHVGGIGMTVGGAIAGFCIDFGGGCGSVRAAAEPWWIAGIITSAIGLLMFIPAIILDVDSGHRRDRMRGHVAFTVGAGGVGIQGSF